MERSFYALTIISSLLLVGCGEVKNKHTTSSSDSVVHAVNDTLPIPYATKSVKNYSKVIGWPENRTPLAPPGFKVTKFADGLQNPRWIYVTATGDILVAEANTESKGIKKVGDKISGKARSQNMGESANRITLLRDKNMDGKPELRQVLLFGLNQPFGMLVLGNSLYVANTDGLMQFPFQDGQTQIKSVGKKILELPVGGYNNHWTRNIIANADQTKIFISVGSGSNVGEHGTGNEIRRANILEINPDGTEERIFAYGLRNPVGMGVDPYSKELWTVVNERDELGDDLVPDYLTKVKENGFYGWPYAYYGQHEDPRLKGQKPELVKQALTPDVSLGAHTASLGMVFYSQKSFPSKYHGGVFVGQHGSWNRSTLSGYKVVFIPFKNGSPSGEPEDFLTGFISDASKSEVFGRPVGVAVLPNGALLVADDASNMIWKIEAETPAR
jgi:glucose/arabinose dehydrogenase